MNDWWFKAQYKWSKQFKRLNDEQLGKFCRALFLYAQTGEIMELDGAEGMLLDIVIDDIEDERQRTDEISKKRSAASKGNKTEQTSTNDNKTEQTHTKGVQKQTNDNKTGNSKEIRDKSKDIDITMTTALVQGGRAKVKRTSKTVWEKQDMVNLAEFFDTAFDELQSEEYWQFVQDTDFDLDLVKYATEIAAENADIINNPIAYITSLLADWRRNALTTPEAVRIYLDKCRAEGKDWWKTS